MIFLPSQSSTSSQICSTVRLTMCGQMCVQPPALHPFVCSTIPHLPRSSSPPKNATNTSARSCSAFPFPFHFYSYSYINNHPLAFMLLFLIRLINLPHVQDVRPSRARQSMPNRLPLSRFKRETRRIGHLTAVRKLEGKGASRRLCQRERERQGSVLRLCRARGGCEGERRQGSMVAAVWIGETWACVAAISMFKDDGHIMSIHKILLVLSLILPLFQPPVHYSSYEQLPPHTPGSPICSFRSLPSGQPSPSAHLPTTCVPTELVKVITLLLST